MSGGALVFTANQGTAAHEGTRGKTAADYRLEEEAALLSACILPFALCLPWPARVCSGCVGWGLFYQLC